MAFHDVRFPPALGFGATGGPERLTRIVALANGHEERNSPWAHSRRRYDAGQGLCSLDDLALVVAFFEARGGQLHGFRWKDWADHKSCPPSGTPSALDQVLGTGDGARSAFQLAKAYASGPATYRRPVTRPVAGTVRVAVDGAATAAFALDAATGVVSLATPPAPGASVTAGFEFDVPVRFDTDRIDVQASTFGAGEAPSVPVIELRA